MIAHNNRKAELMKSLMRKSWSQLVIILVLTFIISASVVKGTESTSGPDKNVISSAEIIRIDKMNVFGVLSEPVVSFPHDRHTKLLLKDKKDCALCHKTVDKKMTLKFMRTDDSDRQTVMDLYHNNCIGCHEKTPDKSGPVVCGDCHIKKKNPDSEKELVDFDKSLHYRHVAAADNKCETCHHALNEKTGKLFYDKGKETTCRYCHEKTVVDNRKSMKDAAHIACIVCHLEKTAVTKNAGPVNCIGCHDTEELKKIRSVKPVPRMDRKQPDFHLIKTGNPELDQPDKNRMDFVPFNHKAHEETNNNCRVCHHKSLSSCSSCHSLLGKKEGGEIPLEQAMHMPDAEQSCIGCHNTVKQTDECLGCHAFIDKTDGKNEKSCSSCHVKTEVTDEAQLKDIILNRSSKMKTQAKLNIPETIIINRLENKYEPTVFPHRKIINTLVEGIDGNTLASAFHKDKKMLCVGCHHSQPVTEKPSDCITCHDPSVNNNKEQPGLKGAYHIQCMECHANMNIDKNGCTDCHKKKKM